MPIDFPILATILVVLIVFLIIYLLVRSRRIKQYYIHVEENQAIAVYKKKNTPFVSFKGAVVLPSDQYALVSLSTLPLVFNFHDKEGLYCKDAAKINLSICLYLHVGHDAPSILKMLAKFGLKEIPDAAICKNAFAPFVKVCVEHVVQNFSFESLFTQRNEFRARISTLMSQPLVNYGYLVEDVAINDLALTPVSELDPNDARDAQSMMQIERIIKRQKRLEQEMKRRQKEDLFRKIEEAQRAIDQL